MTRLLTFLILTALSLAACQQDKPGKGPWIFGYLYVRYLQDGQQIKAEASFFKGDSSHNAAPLSILGGVSFQGSGMESRNIQDKIIRYQYQNAGAYPGSFTFQAQDDNGKPHKFSIEMPPLDSFSLPDTIYRDKGFALAISPASGPQPESLAILLTDQAGQASLVEIPAPISSSISISPGQINRLAPGPYQVYLVKKQHTFLEEGRFKVNCDAEFYTSVKEVTISAE
jgi:hypothetical protein